MGFPLPYTQSDAAAVPSAAPLTLTGAFVAGDAVDVRNFYEVDWALLCTDSAAVTRVDVQWEFAETAVPGASDWAPFQTEVVTAGVSAPSTYEMQQPTPAAPYTRGWTTKVKGRWMRMLVKAGVGAFAGSVIVISALRRVP